MAVELSSLTAIKKISPLCNGQKILGTYCSSPFLPRKVSTRALYLGV